MRNFTIATLLFLVTATTATAQETAQSFKLPSLVYAGAAAFDVASTMHCLSFTGCHEANPVIKGLESHGAIPMLAVGEFIDLGANMVLRKLLAPKHPRLYRATLYAVAGFRTSIAIRNMGQARGQREFNAARGIR